jgi:rod shape-determining protein MreB
MLKSVLGAISADLAVDLGTSTTRIAAADRGIVCCQPSVVAIQEDRTGRRRILAVGDDARVMEGRAPRDIQVVRPIQDGTVSDFEVVEAMLRHLMVQVHGRRLWVGPRIAVATPHGMTDMERRAIRESVEASGARNVHLIEQPLAAGAGAGLPVDEARGHMVIDVGAGMTTVSVLSLGGIVYSRSIKVGGDHMDQALVHHVHEEHGVLISRAMAEELRIELGGALPRSQATTTWVRGRHEDSGFPRAVEINSHAVMLALQEPVELIAETVLRTLERTPPDLASDVAESGIVMTGGLARMPGLEEAVGQACGLAVVVPEDPADAVVMGALQCLNLPEARRATA